MRQLDKILLAAAGYPGTAPELVAERVQAEAKQSAALDAFEFCAERSGDKCVEVVNPKVYRVRPDLELKG